MPIASAPASSANLGPGFDVVALALDIRCEVEAVGADSWSITSDGEAVDDHTAAFVRAVAGSTPKAISIHSDIPMARGLGSSAALRVAVAAAAMSVDTGKEPDLDHLMELVVEAEGHADNAAAAIFGGLTFVDVEGSVHRLGVHPGIEVVVAVPSAPLPTDESRAALPETVSHQMAVRTAARMAALIEGLRTGDPEVLSAAGGDELHEEPRSRLAPMAGDLIAVALAAGAFHACWSGAGPSVLAFVSETASDSVWEAFADVLGDEGEVLDPAIDRLGLIMEP